MKHADGRVVAHEQVLQQEYAREYVKGHPGRFIVCGSAGDVTIESAEQSSAGLSIKICDAGGSRTLLAPLYGLHHAGNVVLAYATAVALGVAPNRAISALRTVPQIKHRLEVKPQPDGTVQIDDAFNSNPQGFVSAIELMAKLAQERNGRGILVTPGVAELGARHDAVHETLGAEAAKTADVVLAVKPDRIPTFLSGFQAANGNKLLHPVATLAEAQAWLAANVRAGDVILFENDLPDVYEKKLKL
jgi:UDP-N-acetylmuramoyl-tripeptide--D-alanyl-D-alanine ligase